MAGKGKLYLVPVLLGDGEITRSLPQYNLDILNTIDFFIVENLRSARRFLVKAGIEKAIDDLEFVELNKYTELKEISGYLKPIEEGRNIGVLSEAGCPGVADPGSIIVKLAHEKGVRVEPMVGPSSILLAMMASGFNGQSFVFHGYLPYEKGKLGQKLKEMESTAVRQQQTQIFMEAPYRNDKLLEEVLKTCSDKTQLCIACDITLPTEYIRTQSILQWKKGNKPSLHKRPCIFLLYV